MKKIIRLTESDLTRLVKRIISEEITKLDDKTYTSQGYGKDPYQYKAILVGQKDQWGGIGPTTVDYYVARKGSNPRWTKVTDVKAKNQIMSQQFPSLANNTQDRGNSENTIKSTSRGDEIIAFSKFFPCVEKSLKPTDRKMYAGESLIYIIDGISYGIRKNPNSPSGWSISGTDPKNALSSKLRTYNTCDEFNRRQK